MNKIRVAVIDRLLAKKEKLRVIINAQLCKPREYAPGDLVLVARNLRKIGFRTNILPKYTGPFQVLRKHSPLSYLVKYVVAKVPRLTCAGNFPAHVSQMKSYRTPRDVE